MNLAGLALLGCIFLWLFGRVVLAIRRAEKDRAGDLIVKLEISDVEAWLLSATLFVGLVAMAWDFFAYLWSPT